MTAPRPILHLQNATRDYPQAWRQYASFIARRREFGDWPSWCYCPMAAAYAVVSGGGDNRVPVDRGTDISRLAALAAWRATQGIYRFDPTLLSELLETPVSGDLPVEHLHRLPEWCVYVELPGTVLSASAADSTLSKPLHGFFAHLEHDAGDGRTELRLVLDVEDQLVPIALHLGSTIDAALAGFIAHANVELAKLRSPIPAFSADLIQQIATVVAPLVSVLLYLCAGDAEMRPTRDPSRQHAHPPVKRGRDGEPYQPPTSVEIWETGFALGAALRDAHEATGASGRAVRGHVRRAHWHGYWTGSAEARTLQLRWLSPILVNLDRPTTPTVRKV